MTAEKHRRPIRRPDFEICFMRVGNPARRDAEVQGTMSGHCIRGRMRGFPFGTFSSFNSLSFGSMTGPSAEREAPYANSPVATGKEAGGDIRRAL